MAIPYPISASTITGVSNGECIVLRPLREVLCEVVGRAHGIALGVGQLAFDNLMIPALFVQER